MNAPTGEVVSQSKLGFLHYLWHEWFRQVGEALLLAFVVTTFLFTTVGVLGDSMVPNLQSGERVFVPKYETWLHRFGIGGFKRGDVVVIKPPEGAPNSVQPMPIFGTPFRPSFIKRVVALPGDWVHMRAGQLYVNGREVDESHTTLYWKQQNNWDQGSPLAFSGEWPFRQTHPAEFEVPKGTYLVMGDNRSAGGSEDSRIFGPVPLNRIAGRASFILWPIGQWGRVVRPEGFKKLEEPTPSQ